jgi:hypothetical protein
MNQSLDGYVDHMAFAPSPTLFHHFIEEAQAQAGSIYGRLARTWDLEEAQGDGPGNGVPPEVRQASFWLRGDIWHEFLGEATTEFYSQTGFIPFTAYLSDNVWKLGLGGTWDFNIDSALYGNVNYAADLRRRRLCLGGEGRLEGDVVTG